MFRSVSALSLSTLLVSTLASSPATAEVLELKSGETLIGRVTEVTNEGLQIRVGFPRNEQLSVQTEQIKPASLYAVLSARIDPNSAKDRAELAQTCLDLGLMGHAIAEFREAISLDPALRDKHGGKIRQIQEEVAEGIFREIQNALKENRLSHAKLNSEVLVEFYPETAAGKKAKRTLDDIMTQKKAMMSREAKKEEAIRTSLKEAERLEARAEKLASRVKSDISRKAKDRKINQQVAQILESAYSKVRNIETLPEERNERYGSELLATQRRLQTKLGQQYLKLGTAFVQIRALPTAEQYSVKACELDSEGRSCARLQNLIIQARLTSGWGRGR